MPKTSKPPSYRRHKATGQAVLTLCDRDYYLGKHATKASRAEYDRLVAEWLANGRRMPQEAGAVASVSELMAAYLRFATGYFRKDGKPTKEIWHVKHMMSGAKRMFKWGVENELVPPSVYHGLQAVAGLKRGRATLGISGK